MGHAGPAPACGPSVRGGHAPGLRRSSGGGVTYPVGPALVAGASGGEHRRMASPLRVSRSRTYPVPVGETFALTLSMPLDELFSRRFGPLPPIKGTTQDGVWSTAGQVRTVHLADGGSMREHLVDVDPPNSFSYELTEVTGPMKPIAARVDGTWSFEAVGSGSRITWTWTIHPAGRLGRVVLPVFGLLWQGYARRSLDRLEPLLLAATAGK